jgi:3-oxoacyl-[acyl-carrier protein] reductase
MGRLDGEIALITGAAQNIVAATAERLAAEGAAIAVNYHPEATREDAETLAARIVSAGGKAVALAGDVGDEPQVAAMAARIRDTLGAPTILVNNAATSIAGAPPWHELEPEAWDRVLRTNITGAVICARALHPFMKARGRGRIISMGSVRSPLGMAGNAHYTASKSALEGLGRVLAREMGPEGITVNTIIVGAIRTPAEAAYGDPAELDRRFIDAQAVKRRGEPKDIAGVVAFLASRDADFITGQSIAVDGGWVMR